MKTNTSPQSTDSASTSADIENKNNSGNHCSQQCSSTDTPFHSYYAGLFGEFTPSTAHPDDIITQFVKDLLRGVTDELTAEFPWKSYKTKIDFDKGGLFFKVGSGNSPLAVCGLATDDESSVGLRRRLETFLAKARVEDPCHHLDSSLPGSTPWMALICAPEESPSTKGPEDQSMVRDFFSIAVIATSIGAAWLEQRHRAGE